MLMNEQRAWLLVSLPPNSSETVSKFVPHPTTLGVLYVYPVVRNHGKTIARITLSKARFLVLPDAQQVPAEPDYEGTGFIPLEEPFCCPQTHQPKGCSRE
jgi:hypothetical protein